MDYLRYVWKKECDMDENVAANMISDMIEKEILKEKESEWRKEKRERIEFVNRIGTRTDPKPDSIVDWNIPKDDEKKVRFLNGEIVTTKGEKYVITEKSKEWDGGSRGRVKTKGKRGKGFV